MSQLTPAMEQKLLVTMLDRTAYAQVERLLQDAPLMGMSSTILSTLTALYQKFPDLQTVSLEELKTQLVLEQSPTRAAKQLLNGYFDAMEMETPCSQEMLVEILSKLHLKAKALEIGQEVASILQGNQDNFEQITKLLENTSGMESLTYDEVSTSLDDLLLQGSPESRFALSLGPLQERIQGMGRGNLAIIFARPEIGKSSLVGHLAAGFMKQRLNVAYFANEEPGYKIMLNMIRAATVKNDAELRADHEAGVAAYEDWDTIKQYLKLHEAVGISLSDINSYAAANSPDVIILDQADKVSISGQFEAGHARLKELYVGTREVAKRNDCLVIDVSQASADAEGKRAITYDMLDGSKTGKAGEADVIIGVGANPGPDEDFLRYITVSKNKISGWHGMLTCTFDPSRNQWSA